jgi:ATP-dependent helicase/nuclease subunit B
MNKTAPTVYSIEPGEAFVDVLAKGIIERVDDAPDALARVRVLLPTRRACRSLREAFLRQSQGRPMLLPQMMPLGDVDEDDLMLGDAALVGLSADTLNLAPAIGGLERQILLAQYVLKMDSDTTPEQAVRLAGELARLIDQVHTEGLDLARLPTLVKDAELARHWDKTVKFLAIVGETWPQVLQDEGVMDPAKRRDLLLRARAHAWAAHPPPDLVIAAGSTGTIPATAELLNVVALLPQGALVLPGLDRTAPDQVWDHLDASHPQYGMAKLLEKLGVERGTVLNWSGSILPGSGATPHARADLLNLALVPAEATPLWRTTAFDAETALDGVARINCENPREEAATIALILRSALEEPEIYPGRTAALITPDRQLARRVAIELNRWGVEVDDSAGLPLDQTQPGAFFHLVADMAAQRFHPIDVLACLKHPLAAGGMTTRDMRRDARALEAACLRGARPADGLNGLEDRLRTFFRDERACRRFARLGFEPAHISSALRVLKDCAQPLADAFVHNELVRPDDLLKHHVLAAEALARTDAPDDERRLWAGDAGEALSAFVAEAHDALTHFAPIRPEHYPALIKAIMANRPVRPRYPRHPRVHIWGLLEARLQRADLVVLGGLNEGTWPADPDPSPWMSRPMMREFGLPLPERRVGLNAHDFVQAACAPRVFITRAKRQGTSPQVPSRWLTRLDTMLGDTAPLPDTSWPAWAESLTKWDGAPEPCAPPRPTPPLAARPRQLSVTKIETWFRDPYAIYAQYVLGLTALDPIDADASAADKGNVVHAVLERFIQHNKDTLPQDALGELLRIGEVVFREEISSPGVRAFWWPRFERIAEWFVGFETKRRADGFLPLLVEKKGSMELESFGGPFTLTAKPDRIDQGPASVLEIIDYKTGVVPTAKQTSKEFSPQLPLEGAIVKAGGFEDAPKHAPISGFLYVKLSGGRVKGEEKPVKLDAEEAVQNAQEGLTKLIHKYDNPDMPYLSKPRVQFTSRYGDFDHLARVKEWKDGSGEGDGE